MANQWIVVADRSLARIYMAHEKKRDEPRLVTELENPGGKARPQELESDRQSSKQSRSTGHHQTMAPHTNAKEKSVDKMAHMLVEFIEEARKEARYSSLVLVMPPKLLGAVKKRLSPVCYNLIRQGIPHNAMNMKPTELIERVRNKWMED